MKNLIGVCFAFVLLFSCNKEPEKVMQTSKSSLREGFIDDGECGNGTTCAIKVPSCEAGFTPPYAAAVKFNEPIHIEWRKIPDNSGWGWLNQDSVKIEILGPNPDYPIRSSRKAANTGVYDYPFDPTWPYYDRNTGNVYYYQIRIKSFNNRGASTGPEDCKWTATSIIFQP